METIPKTNGEFVWVDEVQGDVSNRSNNRLVRVDGEPPRPMNDPVYRSVYASDHGLDEYAQANKGPECDMADFVRPLPTILAVEVST